MEMKIFALGGTGLNLGNRLENFRGTRDVGFCELDISYVDTSKSNVAKLSTDAQNVYLFEGTRGAGKERKDIYDTVFEHRKEILVKFKPSDNVNVLIHSFGGGSGSVIGPVLAGELLQRGAPLIIIGIGSSDSRKEIDNTIKTIQSYENISQKYDTPVCCLYYENSEAMPRGKVDVEVHTAIGLLGAFFSGENHELDSKDLFNFLKFTRVTSFPPQFSFMEFFVGDISVPAGQSLISLATLTDDETSATPNLPVEYQAVGFASSATKEKLQVKMPVHMATLDGAFHSIINSLRTKMEQIDEQRSAHVRKSIAVDGDERSDGTIL